MSPVLAGDPLGPEGGAPGRRSARSYWSESLRRLSRDRIGVGAGSLVAFLILVGIAAPLLATYVGHFSDPDHQVLRDQFAPALGAHVLGADELGRDTFARLVYGARISFLIGFLTVALSILIGGAVGLVAGYYGRIVDRVLMRLVDVLLSVPSFYLIVLISVTHPFGLDSHRPVTLAVILASVGWGGTARLVRGQAIAVRVLDFVLATQSIGASDLRIIVRHLVPNVLPVVIVGASLGVGGVILAEAALDFIGIGISPATATWGNMLTASQTYFYHSLTLVLAPGILIFATVLALNLFGNSVRDAFDPRLK